MPFTYHHPSVHTPTASEKAKEQKARITTAIAKDSVKYRSRK